MKELSAIVVTHDIDIIMFNAMLNSLRNYTPELAQLIIFDNASKINLKWLVDITFKNMGIETDYIRNDINIGYGRACNKTLPFIKHEFMATLNDDIEFFSLWAGKMIDILKTDPMVAQVVPKHGVCNILNEHGDGIQMETDSPDYAEGSCCITRTSLMKKFGFYDEIYEFAYHEDADLSLRLRQAGYKIKNVEMKWIHYGETTASKMRDTIRKYQNKNRQIFKARWSHVFAK
jgi:GT2 family glycosyltransferase